jgi:hypothetical protein
MVTSDSSPSLDGLHLGSVLGPLPLRASLILPSFAMAEMRLMYLFLLLLLTDSYYLKRAGVGYSGYYFLGEGGRA